MLECSLNFSASRLWALHRHYCARGMSHLDRELSGVQQAHMIGEVKGEMWSLEKSTMAVHGGVCCGHDGGGRRGSGHCGAAAAAEVSEGNKVQLESTKVTAKVRVMTTSANLFP